MSGRPWPPRTPEAYRREAAVALAPSLHAAFAAVRLLVLDADGVLTPANILYGPEGEALKEFDSRDGFGLVQAHAAGLKLALLTGRPSRIAERRCRDLGFDVIKLGRFDKVAALREILAETGCTAAETCYVGDDVIDIPALDAVGLPVTVPAAPDEVRERSRYVTLAGGGRGAVREVTDLVLKLRGLYGPALAALAAGPAPHPPEPAAGGNPQPEAPLP